MATRTGRCRSWSRPGSSKRPSFGVTRLGAQAVDLEVAPSEPGSTYGEWYADGWSWWHLPLSTLAEPVQVEAEAGAYSGFSFAAESGFYVSQTAANYSATTLMDLGSGSPAPGLSFPGFTLDIAQVR